MDVRDLRQLPDDRLFNELEDLKEALFNLRFQKSYGQLEDPNALRRAKRDVARILTVIRERQIADGRGIGIMPNTRRRLEGRVVSNKMDKTVVVAIERRKMHPIYKKVVRTTKKIMAHDESNAIEMGALVRVVESRAAQPPQALGGRRSAGSRRCAVLETLPDEQAIVGGGEAD